MKKTQAISKRVRKIEVPLPLFTQTIFVGEELNNLILSKLTPNYDRNIVIVSKSLYPQVNQLISKISKFEPIVINSREENKNFDFVKDLLKTCHSRKVTRDSYIVGIGGGMIGDTVGFLASIYMRGVKFAFIPTTLLSQCDSTMNKVAVSVDDSKNLVGSFYSPELTFCDTKYLKSLSIKHVRDGFVEIIKHSLITNSIPLQNEIRKHLSNDLDNWQSFPWDDLLVASLKVKAEIVSKDPFDRYGHQKGLNYGHTFGHSLETLSEFSFTHGHAVAIGMKIAGHVSNELKMLSDKELQVHNELIDLTQLKLYMPRDFEIDNYIEHLKMDKVNDGSGVRLVLLNKLGEYSLVGNIEENLIRTVIKKYIIKS